MKTIITFIFTITTFFCLAQEIHQFSLQPAIEDTIVNRAFYVTKIIDLRRDKDQIGFVQMGQNNSIIKAKLEEPLTKHLSHVINLILPYKKSSYPVAIKIHQLAIGEKATNFREIGIAELKLEFLSLDEKNSIDTIYTKIESDGVDVTRKHPNRLMNALVQNLQEFNQKVIKLDSLGQLEQNNIVLDFQNDLKDGFYKSFTDLVIQNPIEKLPFHLTKRTDKTERYEVNNPETGLKLKVFGKQYTALGKRLTFSDLIVNKHLYWKNQQELRPIYGLIKDNEIFINASLYTNYSYFVRAKLIGEYLYFEDRINTIKTDIYFGPIGSPLTLGKVGIVLDTKNGKLSILTNSYLL